FSVFFHLRRSRQPMINTSFFFSSRRRHTRSLRDWSSDVCSSDLGAKMIFGTVACAVAKIILAPWRMIPCCSTFVPTMKPAMSAKIGRASCREREEDSKIGEKKNDKHLGDSVRDMDGGDNSAEREQ